MPLKMLIYDPMHTKINHRPGLGRQFRIFSLMIKGVCLVIDPVFMKILSRLFYRNKTQYSRNIGVLF